MTTIVVGDANQSADWKKSIKPALDHFKSVMPGRFKDREWALQRIKNAKRPMAEAKRLMAHFQQKAVVEENPSNGEGVTIEHVRKLAQAIFDRDGVILNPHRRILNRLCQRIEEGMLSIEEFKTRAPDTYRLQQDPTRKYRFPPIPLNVDINEEKPGLVAHSWPLTGTDWENRIRQSRYMNFPDNPEDDGYVYIEAVGNSNSYMGR